jgi:NAD(P)-dependent dehydrogenase (short-subunit alcohol dehydrogenase family)
MASDAAVVTGHSRGIGEAIADQLLGRGIRVLGVARNENAELAARYPDLLTQVRLDLSNAAALTTWLESETLAKHLSGADRRLLVNNAGVLKPLAPLEHQDVAEVIRAITVNVAAVLALSAAFAKETNDGRERRILHISSGAGRKGYAGWSMYCASKAALDNHARAVALDKSPGLRICALAPGVIETEMQVQIRASSDEYVPDRHRFVTMKQQGQLVSPADAGRKVVDLLLSDDFGREPIAELKH